MVGVVAGPVWTSLQTARASLQIIAVMRRFGNRRAPRSLPRTQLGTYLFDSQNLMVDAMLARVLLAAVWHSSNRKNLFQ